MDYEKKYKEALKRAKDVCTYYCDDKQQLIKIESIFPELKESRDERIRKALIELVGMVDIAPIGKIFGIKDSDMFAWLEKQGTSYTKKDVDDAYLKGISDAKNEMEKQYEANYQIRKDIATFIFNYKGDIKDRAKWMDYLGIKAYFFEREDEKHKSKSALEAAKEEKVDNQNCVKPADKFKPKFNEGDWVVYNNDICQIVKREEGCNKLVTVFGIEKELVNERNLSTAHLWTIQDAKPGDVLASDNKCCPFIYRTKTVFGNPVAYCGVRSDGLFISESPVDHQWCLKSEVMPATKEQREKLEKAMADAGYTFDFDKKVLKKIEQKPSDEQMNNL